MLRTILTLLLFPVSAQAVERDLLNAVESVAGVYSSIYIHEFGHAVAYKAIGATDVTIDVPRKGSILSGQTSARFDLALTQDQKMIVSIAGFAAANLAGEVVLQHKGFRTSPYAQAILGTSLASNLLHVFHYYTKIRGVEGYAGNDIDQFELSGGNPHVLSVALAGYTLWTLQRMRKKEVPLFYVNLRF